MPTFPRSTCLVSCRGTIMCICSRNATKTSPQVHSKQLLSTFLSERILCLHIIKWSAAKWAVEHRFSFSPLVKCSKQKHHQKGVKRQGKEKISHANWGKSGQMSVHCWLRQRGENTRLQLNGTTESPDICRHLWGESPFTSPDRQTAPVPIHPSARSHWRRAGSESSIKAGITRLLNSAFPAVITLLNSWI